MTKEERERLLERAEIFCDADRRALITPSMAEKYDLTIEEAMQLLEEGAE